ncbi:MAG: hydroxyacylglutathione hydrolase [Candidatus Latescibacterota bacterium]|jgi:hydroxyacylglutathione hydrolase
MVNIFKSVTGIFIENTYFLINSKEKWGVIVDPGQGALQLLEQLKMEEISWKAIFLTHAHFDHLLGLQEVVDKTNTPIYLHKEDLSLYNRFEKKAAKFGYKVQQLPPPNFFWKDQEVISIGKTNFEIIHTPGHTPGSVCIKWGNQLITGDTLMHRKIGITDRFGSLKEIQKSISQKLFSLPDETVIYPGHQKKSTIGEEKKYNLEIF